MEKRKTEREEGGREGGERERERERENIIITMSYISILCSALHKVQCKARVILSFSGITWPLERQRNSVGVFAWCLSDRQGHCRWSIMKKINALPRSFACSQ